MMIKLTNGWDNVKDQELWLNTHTISGVLQPTEQEEKRGIGAKIYITGEESPWAVRESVREVVDLIAGAE